METKLFVMFHALTIVAVVLIVGAFMLPKLRGYMPFPSCTAENFRENIIVSGSVYFCVSDGDKYFWTRN